MNNMTMKTGLTSEQLMMVQSEVDNKGKNKVVAYLLWFFTSTIAGHRFYLGDTGYAILMLCFGVFTLFIWNLVDVFFIERRLQAHHDKVERQAIDKVKSYEVG